MKTVQIDKVKIRVFEEDDLRNKLNLDEKGIKLVLDYQRTFPELLQDDAEGFVINSRTLHRELGVGRDYSTWIKNRIEKYNFNENIDYKSFWVSEKGRKIDVTNLGDVKLDIENYNQMVRHGFRKDYLFTLEMAKSLAMIENNDLGRLVRDYFVLMERTLRNYKEWADVRGEEKSGYNNMVMELTKWIEGNGHDIKDLKVFRARECNMLNIALTGMSATEIRSYFESKDEITRDNLTTEYNKALSKLQELNTSLLISDLDYTMRSGIIENTCKRQYPHLYVKKQIN